MVDNRIPSNSLANVNAVAFSFGKLYLDGEAHNNSSCQGDRFWNKVERTEFNVANSVDGYQQAIRNSA
jgi:hypothetical protein